MGARLSPMIGHCLEQCDVRGPWSDSVWETGTVVDCLLVVAPVWELGDIVHWFIRSVDLTILLLSICKLLRWLSEWWPRSSGRLRPLGSRLAISKDAAASGRWQRAAVRAACRVLWNALRYRTDIMLYRIGLTVALTK